MEALHRCRTDIAQNLHIITVVCLQYLFADAQLELESLAQRKAAQKSELEQQLEAARRTIAKQAADAEQQAIELRHKLELQQAEAHALMGHHLDPTPLRHLHARNTNKAQPPRSSDLARLVAMCGALRRRLLFVYWLCTISAHLSFL